MKPTLTGPGIDQAAAGAPTPTQLPLNVTPATGAAPVGRAKWHRRANALPLAYLAALAIVGFVHPWLPWWRWSAIHLLLLGAVSNAILVWSAHFTSAVLRIRVTGSRRPEAWRLALLNLGVVGVLAGGTVTTAWAGVVGAGLVFAAIAAHLWWLHRRLRAALPSRLAVTVRYYQAAALALLCGIPVGAWMLVVDDHLRPRLLLFHTHINLLGWVALTVLGTLLTLWPAVLRTRMDPDGIRTARHALPVAGAGLITLATGLLTGWWPVAVLGLGLFATAVVMTGRPALRAALGKPPAAFAAWSIAAGYGWLLVALAMATVNLAGADPSTAADGFGAVLVPLLVGFVGQILVGALAYLLPVVLGGGPQRVRANTDALSRFGAQRVTTANLALAVFLLPMPPTVRITTSLLVLATLGQFLVPAIRLLVTARRTS